MLEEVKHHLQDDPQSATGIRLGEKFMQWVNGLYNKKYAHLRTKKFEKGFREGKGLEATGMTAEMVSWIEQAMDSYWRRRIYDCMALIGQIPSADILDHWNNLLDEMFGDECERKQEIVNAVLMDDTISLEAKKWVRSLSKQ